MELLEVILLIIGGVIFTLSFAIPMKKEEVSGNTKELAKQEIEHLVTREMKDIRTHVDDVVDEAIGYAMEKTERSLERLSNEKIMAVNEYSDTVLQEIHRNHEEVMFLYDMLNDKHVNLKNTVTEVNKTVKEVEETKKEAEAVVNSFQKLVPETVYIVDEPEPVKVPPVKVPPIKAQESAPEKPESVAKQPEMSKNTDNGAAMNISFINESNAGGRNSNDRILELYKQGKSKVAIAKELGLGVGEVKLVIDLHRNV